MKNYIRSFRDNRIITIVITMMLAFIVGFADIVTTSQYRLFFFYTIPIIISSLYINAYYSFFLSCLSTFFIMASSYIDQGALHLFHFWNAGMMLIIFISITFMTRSISKKRIIENEKILLQEKTRMLTASLEEKEMLIRETHHRIKNNLATLSSLISLTDAANSDTLIMKLKNRIQTFTVLYNKLSYAGKDDSQLLLDDYMRGIIDLIIQNYDIPRGSIEVAISGGDFHINAKSASLFGLIINELATNSIRHGFKNMQNEKKIVTVQFSNEGNMVIMRYGDNGPGFDYNSLAADERHLGVYLIDSLTKQLGGEVSHDGGVSSGFTFTFNDDNIIIRDI